MRPSAAQASFELLNGRAQATRQRRARDYMILMAYRHGLRTSEVCALWLSEVKDDVLSVQRVKGRSKPTAQ
jgi:site-specific recombinase XerD